MKKWSRRTSSVRFENRSDRGPPSQEPPSWDSSACAHTHTPLNNKAPTHTHRSIYQGKRERSRQGSLPKMESVCGLLSCISGPMNQSALKELFQVHDCNQSYLPQGLFVTFKVRWQIQIFRVTYSHSSPASGKTLQYLENQLRTSLTAGGSEIGLGLPLISLLNGSPSLTSMLPLQCLP